MEEFLRSRGLFLDDDEFALFEATVQPEDEITAKFYDWSDVVTVVSR